jgi:hypothetical protein
MEETKKMTALGRARVLDLLEPDRLRLPRTPRTPAAAADAETLRTERLLRLEIWKFGLRRWRYIHINCSQSEILS